MDGCLVVFCIAQSVEPSKLVRYPVDSMGGSLVDLGYGHQFVHHLRSETVGRCLVGQKG